MRTKGTATLFCALVSIAGCARPPAQLAESYQGQGWKIELPEPMTEVTAEHVERWSRVPGEFGVLFRNLKGPGSAQAPEGFFLHPKGGKWSLSFSRLPGARSCAAYARTEERRLAEGKAPAQRVRLGEREWARNERTDPSFAMFDASFEETYRVDYSVCEGDSMWIVDLKGPRAAVVSAEAGLKSRLARAELTPSVEKR